MSHGRLDTVLLNREMLPFMIGCDDRRFSVIVAHYSSVSFSWLSIAAGKERLPPK